MIKKSNDKSEKIRNYSPNQKNRIKHHIENHKDGINLLSTIISIVIGVVAIVALYVSIKSYINANEQFEKNSESANTLFQLQLKANKALNDSLIYDNRRLFKKNSKLSDSLYNVQFANEKKMNNSLINEVKSLQGITDSLRKLTQKTLEYSVFAERPILTLYGCKITNNDTIEGEKLFNGIINMSILNSGKRTANNTFVRTILFSKMYLVLKTDISNKTYFNSENGSIKNYDLPISITLDNLKNFYFLVEASYVDDKLPGKRNKVELFHYFKPPGGKYDFNLCDNIDKQILIRMANEYLKDNKLEEILDESN